MATLGKKPAPSQKASSSKPAPPQAAWGDVNEQPRTRAGEASSASSGRLQSFQEKVIGLPLFVPVRYVARNEAIVTAFQRLDSLHTLLGSHFEVHNVLLKVEILPQSIGWVRFSVVIAAIRAFDEYFGVHRSAAFPQKLWHQLAKESEDFQVGSDWRRARIQRGQADDTVLADDEDDPKVRIVGSNALISCFEVQLSMVERLFFCLETPNFSSIASSLFSVAVISGILASAFGFILTSHPTFQEISSECRRFHENSAEPCLSYDCLAKCEPTGVEYLKGLESFCVIIFTIELCLRILLVHRVRFHLLDDGFLKRMIIGAGAMSVTEDRDATSSGGAKRVRSFSDQSIVSAARKHALSLKDTQKKSRTLQYVRTPGVTVDILAVVPFWVEKALASGSNSSAAQFLVALRLLRLLRIMRVFKLGKHGQTFALIMRVARRSTPPMLILLYLVGMVLLIFGSLCWMAEMGQWLPPGHPTLVELDITGRGAFVRNTGQLRDKPDWSETPFRSIPHAAWWVVQTITTVGYGDLFPTSPLGKLNGAICAVIGVVLLAMPVGVIGGNFTDEFDRASAEKILRDEAEKVEKYWIRKARLTELVRPHTQQALREAAIRAGVHEGKQRGGEYQPSAASTVPATFHAPLKGGDGAPVPVATSCDVQALLPRKVVDQPEVPTTAQAACLFTAAQWWIAVLTRPPPVGGPPHLWLPPHKRQKAACRMQRLLCASLNTGIGEGSGLPASASRDAAKLGNALRLWLIDTMSELWVGCNSCEARRKAVQEQNLVLEVATALGRLFRTVVEQHPLPEGALAMKQAPTAASKLHTLGEKQRPSKVQWGPEIHH